MQLKSFPQRLLVLLALLAAVSWLLVLRNPTFQEAPPRETDRARVPSKGGVHSATSPIAITSSTETSEMAGVPARQRAVAAVVGGFVADAATMGLHWIYDPDKLKQLTAARSSPEFYEPPACPFYSYESGAFSPYGDEIFPLLEDVATRGKFDAKEFGDVSYRAAKAYPGRLNHVFKELVAKGDDGKHFPELASDSKDLHGGIKVPILVARYYPNVDELLANVREATKVHQIGEEAEEAAVAIAVLLRQVVMGSTVADAIRALATSEIISAATRTTVQDVINAVQDERYPDAAAAIDQFGKSCALPGVLKGTLFVLLTSSGSYVDALRANMVAGGDNCSRSIVIGAIAAAAAASAESDGVPVEWTTKTKAYKQVMQYAESVAQ